MAKESIRSKVVKDVKAAEKAVMSEEKKITTKIKTKPRGDSKASIDEHVQEEM